MFEQPNDLKWLARDISRLLGWVYFLSWSLSFYPQPWLNWKRKTTTGLTVDFPILNVLGFLGYTVSTACFLCSTTIRQQYAARYPLAPEPTVRLNDLAFALHGFLICIVLYTQVHNRLAIRLWGFKQTERRRASPAALGIIWGCLCAVGIVCVIVWVQRGHASTPWSWRAIDIVYAFSYVKLLITFIKYIPQAWHNFKAQSTVGWAIDMILLDFIGGVLSLLQLIIDSALEADWSGITGNPVKFGLSVVSLFFDVIFLLQHYVLYPARHDGEETDAGIASDESAPLLA